MIEGPHDSDSPIPAITNFGNLYASPFTMRYSLAAHTVAAPTIIENSGKQSLALSHWPLAFG
jgi:hypothetical protein